MNLADFSNNALRRISPADRASLGKAGQTAEEAMQSYCAKSEKELQHQMAGILRQRGIWFYNARMDRKTTAGLGTPDFILALGGTPLAFEAKHEGRRLDPAQKKTIAQMLSNHWHCYVIRRLPEFRDLLNAYQNGTATGQTNIEPEELKP